MEFGPLKTNETTPRSGGGRETGRRGGARRTARGPARNGCGRGVFAVSLIVISHSPNCVRAVHDSVPRGAR